MRQRDQPRRPGPRARRGAGPRPHATYDLDDIPAAVVKRVAEHALGDHLELSAATDLRFLPARRPP
ncbi:MAG TPA: hypothetical protein VFD04_00785 [Actinomycetes bacterium]|nr:hypothetical protein [Actinomycetes bacterium]